MDLSLPNSPRLAGPSSIKGTYLGDDGILELRVDVHSDASIFYNKKLAEDLLDHILLSQDQRKRQSQSIDMIVSDSIYQLHEISVFPNLAQVIFYTLGN